MGAKPSVGSEIKCKPADGASYRLISISDDGSRPEKSVSINENSENGRVWSKQQEGDNRSSIGENTILQFTSAIYYVEESEQAVHIDLMRLGSQRGRVSVNFHTEDMSGKSGERYAATEGCVTFAEGEYQKTISIPIVVSSAWSPTLEFKVCLSHAQGCTLGAYLHTCRVKVIDDQAFPSDTYPEVANGLEAIESIGHLRLFWEYFKLNFFVPGITGRTLVCICFDQMQNAYTYYKLWAIAYLLNDILHDSGGGGFTNIDERSNQAFFIGLVYILPMAALHAWELVQVNLDLIGHSRAFLQNSIITKFLNYTEASRAKVEIAEIEIAVKEDATACAEAYVAALVLLRISVKLIVILSFVQMENPRAMRHVSLMLGLMLVFTICRSNRLSKASELPLHLGSRLQEYVSGVGNNYRLIANYFQRPHINDVFSEKVSRLRVAFTSPGIVCINNAYFTRWLGPLFLGVYIMTHSRSVLLGDLGHGTFIATLNVFIEISGDFSEGYAKIMEMTAIAAILNNLTKLLNLPIDVPTWKVVNRKRRAATQLARETILAKGTDHPYPTDLIAFTFKDVGFRFVDQLDNTSFLHRINLTVPQGCMVAVFGQHGHGKQTFLRLIAHELFPTEGEIFIPTHLRILHVSQEIYILEASPMFNLTFGSADITIDQVRTILARLGAEKVLSHFNDIEQPPTTRSRRSHSSRSAHRGTSSSDSEDEEARRSDRFLSCRWCCPIDAEDDMETSDYAWLKMLSYSEKAKLHLARAFLMNPEVMVLQRPLGHFNQQEQVAMLNLLMENVRNRGISLPSELAQKRRPRTVFLSVENAEQAEKADIVWSMTKSVGSSSVMVVKDLQEMPCRSPLEVQLTSNGFATRL